MTQSHTSNIVTREGVGILLAAGQGKRMRTDLPKVAHTILGKPMIIWAAESLLYAGIRNLVVVISPAQESVEEILKHTQFPENCTVRVAYQDKPMGTGHATACAMNTLNEMIRDKNIDPNNTEIVIGFGDTPAVSPEAFEKCYQHHLKSNNVCTVLAFHAENPSGYGRVITTSSGNFSEIREDKDCTSPQKEIKLCNSGFLCSRLKDLQEALPRLKPNNAAGEYYLTDVPRFIADQNQQVGVFSGIPQEELEGVNSQSQLASMAQFLQNKIIAAWMEKGVQFLMPHCTYVDPNVTFEPGVIVEPFCFLSGHSHFAANSRIVAGSRFVDGKRQ